VDTCKEGQKGALAAVCTPTLKSTSEKQQKLYTSVSEHRECDENQVKEVFIDEGRGHSPSHLKFFLLIFKKLKEDIK